MLNRSVPEAELHWPSEGSDRPQLRIVLGVDLLQGTGDDLAKQLKENVNGLEQLTRVFYLGICYAICVSFNVHLLLTATSVCLNQ